MKNSNLTREDKKYLLQLARKTIVAAVGGKPFPQIQYEGLSKDLLDPGASFVTLTIHGQLRGCIGSLEAHQSLVVDVQEHAVHAALEDYRFPPLSEKEIDQVEIEISRLTAPEKVTYQKPEELPQLLKKGIDGVILKDGFRRSTFLPQVWEQLPDPEEFLSHLCAKMGAPANLWKKKLLEVSIYQVEEFKEE